MARTPSNMLKLGTSLPSFRLQNAVDGRWVSPEDWKSPQGWLVMFICNHCPFVKHIRSGLADLGRDYADRNLAVLAVNSNDVENYPDDSPENMKKEAIAAGYNFPYLFDSTQEFARSLDAACTPDFFLFDADQKLVYRGQFDASRPGNQEPITGHDLRAALEALLHHRPPLADQKPSLGCNIKWKNA